MNYIFSVWRHDYANRSITNLKSIAIVRTRISTWINYIPVYSRIDQEDGHDAEADPEGTTEDVDCIDVPNDAQGLGWFDRRNSTLSTRIYLTQLDFYKTCPRVSGRTHKTTT